MTRHRHPCPCEDCARARAGEDPGFVRGLAIGLLIYLAATVLIIGLFYLARPWVLQP